LAKEPAKATSIKKNNKKNTTRDKSEARKVLKKLLIAALKCSFQN
jgi:hypothetical protein